MDSITTESHIIFGVILYDKKTPTTVKNWERSSFMRGSGGMGVNNSSKTFYP